MYNGVGMKKGRLCKTTFATICETKEGSKSTTDSEKVGICSESKSSISSAEDIEDIEEMADFGTESHSFKFSISVTWTQDDRQFGNYRCFRHKFENLCYTLEEKKKWEVKNELQVTNFELGISIPAVPDGGGKSLNREIS
jgi:hypothetical protein